MKINTPINMKQYRLFVLLCVLFVFALSPLLATAQNKEVRMELMPKTINVDETPIDFYDDGGPDGKTSSEFKDGKTSSVTFTPQVAGKKVQVDFKLVDIFEGTLYRQFIHVYDGTEAKADRLLATLHKGSTRIVKATNPQGALTVVFGSTASFTSNGFKAVVSLFTPQPMRFRDITISHMQDAPLVAGDKAQPLLAFNVRTQETEPALTLNSLTVKASGPITGIQLYQSTSGTDLSTAHRIAEAKLVNGEAVLHVASTPALRSDDNFFWLGCDVADEAQNGNTLSVSLARLVLSDGEHTLSTSQLTGERMVENTIFALEGTQQRRVNGELTFMSKKNTYNDNYEGGDKNRITTFTPAHEGHVVQIDFTKFDIMYSSRTDLGVRAKFIVYEGIGTKGRILWELTSPADKQRGPGQTLRSQSADGALTIMFNPNDSHHTAKGFSARVSEYRPKVMSLAGVDVRQASTEGVAPGAKRQSLLLVNLRTEGNLQPITLQNLQLDLKNSLPAITALQLFKQPNATPEAAPSGNPLATIDQAALSQQQDIALSQPLSLAEGDNWLLLCADVANNAQAGKTLDAALIHVKTSLGEIAVQQGDPAGERRVEYERSLTKGDNGRIELDENTTFTLYDDGGKDKNESKGFDGQITFVPKAPGTVIAIKPTVWGLAATDKLEVYFGMEKKTKPDLSFSRNDRFDKLLSTSPDGAITLRYTTGKYVGSEGFALEMSAIKPQPLAISAVKVMSVAPKNVFKGQTHIPLLHVVVSVSGEKGELELTQIRAPWQGTAAVDRAEIYATDLNTTFATSKGIGSSNSNEGLFPIGYTINKAGEYHFWLTTDMPTTAKVGETVSISLVDITADNTTVLPQTTETASTSVAQGISGTINVGANATYTTIQGAVDALKAGMDGPVTISIESGKYNERVNIPQVPGMSHTNTLTLRAASGKRGDVHIYHDHFSKGGYDPDQMSNDYGVVTIDGADYTTLEALEISTQDPTYPGVIHLRNQSRNVTVDNCYIHAPQSTNIQQKVTLVNMYSKNVANANNDYFTLKRSLLEGGYTGVRLGGTGFVSLLAEMGGQVVGNVLRNQGAKAIYVAREIGAQVEDNIIENETSTHNDFNGIDIDASGSVQIMRNRIRLATKEYCTAIYVRNMSGTLASLATIANNAVWVKHTDTAKKSYASKLLTLKGGSSALLITHNTLCMEGNEKDVTVSILGAMGEGVQLTNNVLQNNGKGPVYQCLRKENLATLQLDHNNLYTNGNALADVKTPVTTLAAWMALSGEQYAYNNKVEFASDVLLQPMSEKGLRHGKLAGMVSTDILGKARDISTPLIGAYEHAWQSPPTGITKPSVSADDIKLSVENGVLKLADVPQGAVVEVFSTSGTLLSRHALPANADSLQVANLPQGVLVVRVTWTNGRWSKAIRSAF
ncbi:hypothetical protein [Hoylesella loescheii]|uniref:hypothetical protein n=1 Tax=Hoylesella loescheii TaxID=840 RepID=UPI0026EDE413|nr:hypothetical protein [Hoylesella loescheii]